MEDPQLENDREMGELRLRLGSRRLSGWCLKVAVNGDVCVEGTLEGAGRAWHTTAIRTALQPDLLLSYSGSHYVLIGPLDRPAAKSMGFPNRILDEFEGGFPSNWRSIIDQFVERVNARNNANVSVWYENCTSVNAPASTYRRRDSIPLHIAVERFTKQNLAQENAKKTTMQPPSKIPKPLPKPLIKETQADEERREKRGEAVKPLTPRNRVDTPRLKRPTPKGRSSSSPSPKRRPALHPTPPPSPLAAGGMNEKPLPAEKGKNSSEQVDTPRPRKKAPVSLTPNVTTRSAKKLKPDSPAPSNVMEASPQGRRSSRKRSAKKTQVEEVVTLANVAVAEDSPQGQKKAPLQPSSSSKKTHVENVVTAENVMTTAEDSPRGQKTPLQSKDHSSSKVQSAEKSQRRTSVLSVEENPRDLHSLQSSEEHSEKKSLEKSVTVETGPVTVANTEGQPTGCTPISRVKKGVSKSAQKTTPRRVKKTPIRTSLPLHANTRKSPRFSRQQQVEEETEDDPTQQSDPSDHLEVPKRLESEASPGEEPEAEIQELVAEEDAEEVEEDPEESSQSSLFPTPLEDNEVPMGCKVLEQWRVKSAVDGEVCVEGVLASGEVWHTSAVRSTQGPRVVVTGSGSRYFLQGPMDTLTPGSIIPEEMRPKFTNGFHKHWKELLYHIVVDAIKSRNFATAAWFQDAQRAQKLKGPERVEEEEDEAEAMPIVEMPPSDSEDDQRRSREPSPAPPPPPVKKRKSEEVTAVPLHAWSLVLLHHKAVLVQGRMPGNQAPWTTSKIARAYAADVVETKSGSRYKLVGKPDHQRTFLKGKFPENLLDNFAQGFPRNWKKLIEEHYKSVLGGRNESRLGSAMGQTTLGQTQVSHFLESTNRSLPHSTLPTFPSRLVAGRSQTSSQDSGDESVAGKPKAVMDEGSDEVFAKPKKPSKKKKVRKLDRTREQSVGGESGFGEARRSSSGRLLKAPMATWSGERIVYDAHGEPVSIAAPVTATQAYKDTNRSQLIADLSRTMELRLAVNKQEEPQRRLSAGNKTKRRRVIVQDSDEEEESDDSFASPPSSKRKGAEKRGKKKVSPMVVKTVKEKPVRWVERDLRRLQLALNAIKPAWDDMESWSKVARSLGDEGPGTLPLEKIRKKAQDFFGYDIRLQNDAEQDVIRQRAEAERELSGKRRVAGSQAAATEARRFMDSMARSVSANASQDVFDASVLPVLNPSVNQIKLQSLAELDESDMSDALTPERVGRRFRAEKRFLPPRPSESDTPRHSASSDPDTPASSTRHNSAMQRLQYYRRHPGNNTLSSSALHNNSTLTHSRLPTRREANATARKVEEQLRRARNAALSDSSDEEEYEQDDE